MGRRTNNADILNAKVVSFDADRGKVNLAPYTSSTVATSLTATSTVLSLVGPGVVNLAQFTDGTGTPIKVRVNIDGSDISLSTGAGAGVYPIIGMNYQTTGQMVFEQVPFRNNFDVFVSKATGVATNITFATAYRLVEL